MELSEKLKKCRTSKKMTQADVAEKLHISRKTVSGWENGRSYPDIRSIVELSDLFGISTDELLRDDQVLEHFSEQNEQAIRNRNVIKVTYILNVFLLVANYFHMFNVFGVHSIFIPTLLVINIIVFLTHFYKWHIFLKKSVLLELIISFFVVFLLNTGMLAFNSHFLSSIGENLYYNTGIMLGQFILILLTTISWIILIFFRNKE